MKDMPVKNALRSEREWDRRLGIRTIGREDERSAVSMPYEPTPYPVLARLAEGGFISARDHLIDYGCGKGRAVFFLAEAAGCRATGVDHSDSLIRAARENALSFPHPGRVAFVCGRAEKFEPRDAGAAFFFNPFSETVFASVLRRLARQAAEAARPVTVICYYPSPAYERCLSDTEGAALVAEIGCGDLFSRRDPRERLIVWRLTPPKGAVPCR